MKERQHTQAYVDTLHQDITHLRYRLIAAETGMTRAAIISFVAGILVGGASVWAIVGMR